MLTGSSREERKITMKIFKKSFVLLVGIAAGITSGVSHADTIVVPATATVQAATLTLATDQDFDFGTIIPGTNASDITIDASAGSASPAKTSGNASVTGGASGHITVGTNIDASVTISYAMVGSGSTVETLESGGNSMAISNASITANSTSSPLAITAAGTNEIHVGGILKVGASQASGTYTGDCTVTINY